MAPQIPKTHKAAVAQKEGGTFEIVDIPTPQPGAGEVLVEVKYSGVCHTDYHALIGDWPAHAKFPLCGGHEGAGVVVALGEGADKYHKVGDHVGLKWLYSSCLNCDFCRHGNEPNCQSFECHGFTKPGSFQQYAITDASHATPIPKSLPLDAAAPLLCAGVTVWKAVKTSGLTPGQTICVSGSGGGLGHLAIQYARAAGLRVIGIDTGAEKRKLSMELGCSEFVDFREQKDIVQAVKAATEDGLGPHAALVASSDAKAYEQALEYLRPTGVLVPVGLPPNAVIKMDVFWGVFMSKQIRPSYVGNRQDAVEALAFAVDGKVKVEYKVKGLSELPQVYDDMHHGRIAGRIVLDNSR